MNRILMLTWFVVSLAAGVQADRLLDSEETTLLVRQLTDAPRRQWLSSGTLRARHLEYYAFENKVRESTETAYSNGTYLRLDVQLDEEQSTEVELTAETARQLNQDFQLNRSRIFLWDGQKRVQYYESADYAVVSMNQATAPKLCGPLTAGIVPWGHGDFTYLLLMSQSPKAYERTRDGQSQFVLTYINETTTPDINVTFVLDPSKANAVLSYTIENEQAMLRQSYSNYLQIGDRWVPSKILIERFIKVSGAAKLLSYEDWQFEEIDGTVPASGVFSLRYNNGTTVELHPGAGLKTFLYQASDRVDISTLLADKIELLASDRSSVNCATAAMQHIAKQFSKELPQETLSELISEQTQKTTLYDMKQTLENTGLQCMAVETDLETLEQIDGCQTVLYLAVSNHYVLLDHVENDGAWIIDLTNRSFYTKLDIDDLLVEWNSGTALLVSDGPITPPLDATFRYLAVDEMTQIQGGDFGTYSCTDLLQEEVQILCSDPMGGFLCGGAYYAFYERYGCKEDADGGTCVGKKMIAYDYAQCINDPEVQGVCTTTNQWTSRYRRACK